jgi:phosphonate transport system permease protein
MTAVNPLLTIPETPLSRKLVRLLAALVLAVVLAWAWQGSEMRPLDLYEYRNNMAAYLSGFLAPDFSDWRDYLHQTAVTIQIAIWGTLLSFIGAVPLGLLSSANVTPAWIHQPVRRVMDACRSINEMIFAMLFISAVGLGPFAGVLALFMHTLGTLAKLFSEAVEAIDPQPVEGIRATGASKLQEIAYGIIPRWCRFGFPTPVPVRIQRALGKRRGHGGAGGSRHVCGRHPQLQRGNLGHANHPGGGGEPAGFRIGHVQALYLTRWSFNMPRKAPSPSKNQCRRPCHLHPPGGTVRCPPPGRIDEPADIHREMKWLRARQILRASYLVAAERKRTCGGHRRGADGVIDRDERPLWPGDRTQRGRRASRPGLRYAPAGARGILASRTRGGRLHHQLQHPPNRRPPLLRARGVSGNRLPV